MIQTEEELEALFKNEISIFTLRFTDPEVENEYKYYRANGKLIPKWLAWLLISLVVLLMARRIQVIILAYLIPEATYADTRMEWMVIAILFISSFIEIAFVFCKCLILMRGFPLLFSLIFITTYSSYFYHSTLAVLPCS